MKNIIKLLGIKSCSDFQLSLKIKVSTVYTLLFLIKVDAYTENYNFNSLFNEHINYFQDITVTGIVTCKDVIPLLGVSVQIKGSSIGKITDFDVLDLPEWMELRNTATLETWNFANRVFQYNNKNLEEAITDPFNRVAFTRFYSDEEINNAQVIQGTDWLDLVTRNGMTTQHDPSLRFNLDQKFNKYLKLGMNFTTSGINNSNSQLGGDEFENSGLIRSALQYDPHIAAIDQDEYPPLNPNSAIQPNPYSLLTTIDESIIDRKLMNFFVEIRSLTARSHEYWCENGQCIADLIRHGKYTEYKNEFNGVSFQS